MPWGPKGGTGHLAIMGPPGRFVREDKTPPSKWAPKGAQRGVGKATGEEMEQYLLLYSPFPSCEASPPSLRDLWNLGSPEKSPVLFLHPTTSRIGCSLKKLPDPLESGFKLSWGPSGADVPWAPMSSGRGGKGASKQPEFTTWDEWTHPQVGESIQDSGLAGRKEQLYQLSPRIKSTTPNSPSLSPLWAWAP